MKCSGANEESVLLDRLGTATPVGRGSSGRVYRAFDPARGCDVAIKVVPCTTPEWLARAHREAQLQARIEHPNIARVYGFGERDGEFCLVMQYIDGAPADEACRHLSLVQIAGVIAKVAGALDAAHQAGLVHRDIKPGNVMVARDSNGEPVPYVVDFGLARDLSAEGLTETGAMLGTPGYMAPEQVRGEHHRVDARSDVFGLGALAYALFTGAPAFAGQSSAERVLAVARGSVRTQTPAYRSLPLALRAVLARCLQARPQDRYPSALALAEDLKRWQRGETPLALRGHRWRTARDLLRRHPRAVAMLSLAVVLASLVLWGLWREQRHAGEAARFASAAAAIEADVQMAHLMPEHPLQSLRDDLRARLIALENASERSATVVRRHAGLALARARLALDEPEHALRLLADVRKDGAGGPEVAFEEGRAQARLYRRELLRAMETLDPVLAGLRRDRAVRDHAQPALAAFGDAQTLTDSRGRLAIAYRHGLGGEPEAGLRALADIDTPLLLDALILRAELSGDVAEQTLRRRASEGALTQVGEALDRAAAATTALRSSPVAQAAHCRAQMLALRAEQILPLPPFADSGACAVSTRLTPGDADAWITAIAQQTLAAVVARRRGRDDAPALAFVEQAIAQALESGIPPAALAPVRVQALLVQVQREADLGRDATALLDQATALLAAGDEADDRFDLLIARHELDMVTARFGRASERDAASARAMAVAERLVAFSPDNASLRNRLGAALDDMAYQRLRLGRDPEDFSQRAVAHHEHVRDIDPESVSNLANLGLALWTHADVATWQGENPEPHFAASAQASDAVLQRDPQHRNALSNLGGTLTGWAEWRIAHGLDAHDLLARADSARARLLALTENRFAIPCDLARLHLAKARAQGDDVLLDEAIGMARDGLSHPDSDCAVLMAAGYQEAARRGRPPTPEALRELAAQPDLSMEARLRLMLLDAQICDLNCTGLALGCRPAPGESGRELACLHEALETALQQHRHLRWRLQ